MDPGQFKPVLFTSQLYLYFNLSFIKYCAGKLYRTLKRREDSCLQFKPIHKSLKCKVSFC